MTPTYVIQFSAQKNAAPLAIIALKGAQELAKQIDARLVKMFK